MKPYLLALEIFLFKYVYSINLKEKFSWPFIDFTFKDNETRQSAIANSVYDPLRNQPLGIEIWQDKLFVGITRLYDDEGVPSTLNYVNTSSQEKSPLLTPYPNWELNNVSTGSLYSTLNMDIDACDRLWLTDFSRITDHSYIMIVDLKTNTLIKTVNLTKEYAFFLGNIIVDVNETNCEKAVAYISAAACYSDHFDILVFDLENEKLSITSRPFFMSNSSSFQHYNNEAAEKLGFITFLSGIALSDRNEQGYRTLYIQPANMSYVFSTSTKTLLHPNAEETDIFNILGYKGANMDSNFLHLDEETGVLFYDLRNQNAIGCWNSRKHPNEFTPNTTDIIQSETQLNLIFNLKGDKVGNLWIAMVDDTNNKQGDISILYSNIRKLIKGTICE